MASAETAIMLPSSPQTCIITKSSRHLSCILSSSPLPSPSQFTKGRLATVAAGGSIAASDPDIRAFTTASNLLRKISQAPALDHIAHVASRAADAPPELPSPSSKTTSKTKRKSNDDGDPVAAPKKARVSRKKTVPSGPTRDKSPTGGSTPVMQDKVAKKPRAKKIPQDPNPIILKGKVTKAGVCDGKEAGAKESTCLALTEVSDVSSKMKPRKRASARIVDEPLGLEVAARRRRAWTPISDLDTGIAEPLEPSPSTADSPLPAEEADAIECGREKPFGLLMEKYGHPVGRHEKGPKLSPQILGKPTANRRELVMIDAPIPPPQAKPAKKIKPKAPKKKAQTLTDKATEQFTPQNPASSSLMLQYLSQASLRESVADAVGLPANDRPQSLTAKSKISSNFILPPEEAVELARNQDLLFGTSSQLAREESPALTRDLQQAIALSESTCQPQSSISDMSAISVMSSDHRLSKWANSKNLWSVAARDHENSLLNTEIIDLANTPKFKHPLLNASMAQIPNVATDTILLPSPSSTPISTVPSDHFIDIEASPILLPKSMAEAGLRQRPKCKSPVKEKSTRTKVAAEQMPNFQSFTLTQLNKAIAGYGFKAVKRRDAMIALLEKCWESKSKLSLQPLPSNLNNPRLQSDAAGEVKPGLGEPREPSLDANGSPVIGDLPRIPSSRPRGRPKKIPAAPSTSTAVQAESSTELTTSNTKNKAKGKQPVMTVSGRCMTPGPIATLSPSRHGPPEMQPPSLGTVSRLVDDLTSSDASGTSSMHLLAKITEAITSVPPSHDPKRLTWHEKIMIYDPIILENLTAWLNTEGLGLVGVDEEVGSGMVREWCEAKSVCCLWKENLRGKERTRY